jgi:hypothetical protein
MTILNLIIISPLHAAGMCYEILGPSDPGDLVVQKILDIEYQRSLYQTKKNTLAIEIAQLQNKLLSLQEATQLDKMLSFIKVGPDLAVQIKSLDSDIKIKTDQQKQLQIELRKNQVSALSELSNSLEISFRYSLKDLFVNSSKHLFVILKKDPLVHLSDNRVGLPITVKDGTLNQEFNLIGILDLTDTSNLSPAKFQWFALIDPLALVKGPPNLFTSLKSSRTLDYRNFKPISNSKIGAVFEQYDIRIQSETLDIINDKFFRNTFIKKQIETIIGFLVLSREYRHEIHKPLLASYIHLISLNPESLNDQEMYLKNYPTSAALLAQSLDVKYQDQLTKFHLALTANILKTGRYPLSDQYFRVLNVNLPEVYNELKICMSMLTWKEAQDALAMHMPEFTERDYRVSETAHITSFEARIWHIGRKALNPNITSARR